VATVDGLARLSDRIAGAKTLLSEHLAVSPVFALLEQNVIKNVQLKTMKFSYAGSDKIKIDLAGTALSYEALSKQADVFSTSTLQRFIASPVVSDFSPNPDGRVSFNFTATVNPSMVSYAGLKNPATTTTSTRTSSNISTSSPTLTPTSTSTVASSTLRVATSTSIR
jgi:hypothetical protein